MEPVSAGHDKKIVLVVDDTPDNLALMGGLLKDDYLVKVANSGEKALRIASSEHPPDLILLDIMMPGMDGYEVCRRLKEERTTREIPVIFLTALNDEADEQRGLELGAVDYITKPVSPPLVLTRVATHLRLKETADCLRDQNSFLEKEVTRRTLEIRTIQEVTILALASLAETRDTDTGNHLRRTQLYVKALAESLQDSARFSGALSDSAVTMLFKSAPLHDIGKVGIPDRILLKPGKLEPAEFEVMKQHTVIGRDAIEHAEQHLGRHVDFLHMAKEIALYHHEKWDGSGYPDGLAGDRIPVPARLMALADVYDALISRRSYKEGLGHEEALRIITAGRGSHFDPDVVDSFLGLGETFREIAGSFTDPE